MQIICSRQRGCSCGFNLAFLFSRFRTCSRIHFRTSPIPSEVAETPAVCPTHALVHWQVLREDGSGSKPSSPEEDLRLSPAPSYMPKMTQASDSSAGAYPAASGSPRPNRLHKTTQLNIASSDLWSSTSLCTSSSPLLRHPRRVRSIRLHICSPHANLPQIRRPSEGSAAAGVRSLLVAQWSCGASTSGSTQPGGLAWPLPLVPLVPIQLPTLSSSHPPPTPPTQGNACSVQDPLAFAFTTAVETSTATAAITAIHQGCRQ